MKKKVFALVTVVFAAMVAMVALSGCGGSGKSSDAAQDADVTTYPVHIVVKCDENLFLSRYDVDVQIDGETVGSVDHGASKKIDTEVSEGSHEVTFKEQGGSADGSEDFTVSEEMYLVAELKCKSDQVKLETYAALTVDEYNALGDSSSDDSADEEAAEDESEEAAEDEADEAEAKELESIEATYNGSTKGGTKVSSKSDFTVTANYSDGSSEEVDGWKVKKSKKVKSGETVKVVVKYQGKSDTVKIEGDIPTEWENAVAKAQSYSDNLYMSKSGIYKQLTSSVEGFKKKAAKYAVNHIDVNWKYNALQKAKSYYENMNMSKSRIYTQLTSSYGEGFTAKQARYAINHLDD